MIPSLMEVLLFFVELSEQKTESHSLGKSNIPGGVRASKGGVQASKAVVQVITDVRTADPLKKSQNTEVLANEKKRRRLCRD